MKLVLKQTLVQLSFGAVIGVIMVGLEIPTNMDTFLAFCFGAITAIGGCFIVEVLK